ncbi:MAG: hypothetical protein FWG89_00710 [Treponema sp.]|nr:hypothetical protein [Treponema sp.]
MEMLPTTEADLRAAVAANPQGIEARVLQQLESGRIAAQQTGKIVGGQQVKQTVGGGMAAIAVDENGNSRLVTDQEAANIAYDQLRAITVLTNDFNPATLLHEWLHFMTRVIIPNSPQYKALVEDAVSKAFKEDIKLENFQKKHHEWLADNFEHYLKTGEAPTAGLKAVFRRIAAAFKDWIAKSPLARDTKWTGNPELKFFFDQILRGEEGAVLGGDAQSQETTRVQTDNAQQHEYAEMTEPERVLQSDLHTAEEKAEMLYSMARAQQEALRNMEAIEVPAEAIEKKAAKGIYAKIQTRQNKQTGQTALFVTRSLKKILRHKGFDNRVISVLAEAFENAVFMYDETVDVSHKKHTNFTGYSHYAAKITIDGQPVYARFTLENLKTKPGKPKISQFHSVHLSHEVKNNAAGPRVNPSIITTATWGASGTTDLKLQQWLNNVNSNSSKMNFQIIGEKGAQALDQAREATARLDNLETARHMEQAGKDAKAVRMATGWERGADGKWRHEIRDIQLIKRDIFRIGKNVTLNLSHIVKNKELFTAYPQLRKMPVRFESLDGGGGMYRNGEITLDSQYLSVDYDNWTGVFKGEAESILVHEIQHAIQDIEGFAQGGNPQGIDATLRDQAVAIIETLNDEQLEAHDTWKREAMIKDMRLHGIMQVFGRTAAGCGLCWDIRVQNPFDHRKRE